MAFHSLKCPCLTYDTGAQIVGMISFVTFTLYIVKLFIFTIKETFRMTSALLILYLIQSI